MQEGLWRMGATGLFCTLTCEMLKLTNNLVLFTMSKNLWLCTKYVCRNGVKNENCDIGA